MLTTCEICNKQYDKKKGTKKAYNFCSKSCSRKSHYRKNIEKMRAEKIRYGMKHKKEKAAYDILYRAKNKIKIASYKKQWGREKQKNDIIYKIKRNLRRRVHHALVDNYKSDNTMNLIGCTIEFFIKHIESQWHEGMSWDNYGREGWHIDHIIPCYTFDLSKPEQQRQCFHYSNQRPLWAKDNLSRKRNQEI